MRWDSAAAVRQQSEAVRFVPIVNHMRQHVRIGAVRDAFKEVSVQNVKSIVQAGGLEPVNGRFGHGWALKNRTVQARIRLKQGGEQITGSAAHIENSVHV